MDHPRALRHASDGEPVAGDRALLRTAVGGQDRLRRGCASLRVRATAAASRTPRSTFSSGSGTPMTPVDRTSTSSGRRPSALRRLRRRAPPRRRCRASPVAAFATPEFTTTACGSASSRCRRETVTGAACTRFVVQTAPPTAAWQRANEGEVEPRASDSCADPGGDEAPGGGDRHSDEHSGEPQPHRLLEVRREG